MQISRNWRLRVQRYRLQGFRHRDGQPSLQQRLPARHAQLHSDPALPARTRA